jgi:hypothetical protein
MVSPSARPRPSIVPPIIPPRPKGSTTARIMPHRVAPRAKAPSRSPIGARENDSFIMLVMIGTIMRATTIPAMNVDEVNNELFGSGLSGSTPST